MLETVQVQWNTTFWNSFCEDEKWRYQGHLKGLLKMSPWAYASVFQVCIHLDGISELRCIGTFNLTHNVNLFSRSLYLYHQSIRMFVVPHHWQHYCHIFINLTGKKWCFILVKIVFIWFILVIIVFPYN